MTEKKLKLRPSVKKKWLAALRSGKYKKTIGTLRDSDDDFCCLGVLCNIHAQEHPKFAKTQEDPRSYDDEEDYPSGRVLKWAFGDTYSPTLEPLIDVDNPVKNSKQTTITLATLNDDFNYTFKDIANVIEKQL